MFILKVSHVLIIIGLLLISFGLYIDSNIFFLSNSIENIDKIKEEENIVQQDISDIAYNMNNIINDKEIVNVAQNIVRVEVYDGMTLDELSIKLNKSLKGILSKKGNLIATRCLKYGVDPYVAVAIMLHETGCNSRCSILSTKYYNVGGMRGSKGYMHFKSIDDGIIKFIDNLYKGYYKIGLNTPEKMNKKYAESSTWATKINEYVKKIRNK